MALTYRQTKGSALTTQELDANFQYFTGSHAITGSLVVSGSTLSPLTLLNLPEFDGDDSNAAALAAGLTAGMIYRSGDFLCVVNNDL
jgi:hypothetical protein